MAHGLRLRAVGAARTAARPASSPRVSPVFATSRASSQRSCAFASRLSTSTRVNTTSHAELLRPTKNRRCVPTQITTRQGFHATAAVQKDFGELRERLDSALLSRVTDGLKHTSLTPSQSLATELLSLQRPDAILQARSGSGKTLAFLLPALQKSIEQGPRKQQISALIIAPTREVGAQIYETAQDLMKDHPKHGVMFVHGEPNKTKQAKRLLQNPDIVICTHRQLLEHLQDEKVAKILNNVDTIVVDDADQLLEKHRGEGTVSDLLRKIPRDESATQTILICTNVTPEVEELASAHCRPGYQTISGPNNETALLNGRQHEVVELPDFQSVASGLAAYVKEEMARGGPFKAIVYAPTTHSIDLYERLLNRHKDLPKVLPLHSNKTPSQRHRSRNAFQENESAIILTTDAHVRGLNFPEVSAVVHLGAPLTKEDYAERLKHTTAGGRSVLFLAESEKKVVDKKLGHVQFAPREVDYKTAESGIKLKPRHLEKFYQAWVSNYARLRNDLEWSDEDLMREANALADAFGSESPLALSERAVQYIGMNPNTPGLRIKTKTSEPTVGQGTEAINE